MCPKLQDTRDLNRNGTCILQATLLRGTDCIEATWNDGSGRLIEKGTEVVISREHPSIDKLRTCYVVKRESRRLQLRPVPEEDIGDGTWRLDVQANYVPLYRVGHAIECFTDVPPNTPPSPVQVLIGTCFGDSKERRAINESTCRPLEINTEVYTSLNITIIQIIRTQR